MATASTLGTMSPKLFPEVPAAFVYLFTMLYSIQR